MNSVYKIFLPLIINFQLSIINCFSQQAPGIEWQNTIGGEEAELVLSFQQTIDLCSINQTNDGGYFLAGYSISNISGDKAENNIGNSGLNDFWVLKLDSAGNIQWQNTIGGNDEDVLYTAIQTTDGGFILGGYSDSYVSGDKTEPCLGYKDYWIVKLSSVGNIQWQNTIGGDGDDLLYSIDQTSDGGYILGGTSGSDSSGDKTENRIGNLGWEDYWIVKIDSSGNVIWDNTIGGDKVDFLYSIKQVSDGGYILGGMSESDSSGDKTENTIGNLGIEDYWILKLDSQGNIQWQNTIGGNGGEWVMSVEQTFDGGYILGGSSWSNISGDKTENCLGNWDYWVVKLDSTGDIQWQNTIGGTNWDWLNSIQQTDNGEYILGGFSESNISGDKTEDCLGQADYWVIKLDSNGNILWQNTIGGSSEDQLYSISETNDKGYILAGRSFSNISGDKNENTIGLTGFSDYWIVKLFPDTITGIINHQSTINNLQILPNPSSGIFQITFPNQKTSCMLEVINTLGQIVFKSAIKNSKSAIALDLSFLPKGIYVLKISGGKDVASKNLIIR